jgi:hypothetical protein
MFPIFREVNMISDDDIVWICQYCGVHNTLWVDFTIPGKQDIIEDCRICCRPNRIITTVDSEENVYVESRISDD